MTSPGLRVSLEAIELRGPGLAGWDAARPILAGVASYCATPIQIEPPAQLTPAERRRAIPSVRLALAVAAAAVAQSGHDAASLPAVFAASGADGDTIGAILSALATPGREVSPTRFHNSVHNAPSGYWGVAVQSREPVTSLSAHDASFAAGLLEAAVQAAAAGRAVLLVAYDLPYPHPLDRVRHIAASFGVALVLAPAATPRTLATIELRMAPAGPATPCAEPALDALRRGNPAARSLPLLAALAAEAPAMIRLAFGTRALEVTLAPAQATQARARRAAAGPAP